MKISQFKVEIIPEKCIGYKKCGLCIDACEEKILIPNEETGKVKVNEETKILCDGIGVCLNVCPTKAIKITKEEVEVKESNEKKENNNTNNNNSGKCSCSSSAPKLLNNQNQNSLINKIPIGEVQSQLKNWPVQLHLLNPMAPYFKDCELLICADCVPFAYGNFHNDFVKGNVVAIGCPKLDNVEPYVEKIRTIVKLNNIKKVTVAIMVVPCCTGLGRMVEQALDGINCEIEKKIISLDGKLLNK